MEKKTGIKYTVKGFDDTNKFALGILALTNVKSSRQGTIVDIKTHEGTNLVSVISLIDIRSDLESLMGEISYQEEIQIVAVDFDDLKDKGQKVISDLIDDQVDYFLSIENE